MPDPQPRYKKILLKMSGEVPYRLVKQFLRYRIMGERHKDFTGSLFKLIELIFHTF